MSDEKRCDNCANYRWGLRRVEVSFGGDWSVGPFCALDRPLIPCEFYEREVGADDDRPA